MAVVTQPKTGLFPQAKDIQLNCNCPDWADLCKHLAAVLYGVGALLDKQPELLFKLRGVDHEELISTNITIPAGTGKRRRLESNIGDVFGIEFDSSVDNNLRDSAGQQINKNSSARNKRAQMKKVDKSHSALSNTRQPTRKKPFNPTSTTVSRLRKRLGLNCAQFAQLIGVSSASITCWENKGGRLNLRESSKQALSMAVELEKPEARKKLGLR
ncbi:MAG: putative Zn finger protein [Gammaproteobacteria bacterium]|jgi:uncharacterized Zn finger protein